MTEKKEVLLTKHTNYLSSYDHHTPDELIKMANRMKEDGISSFRVCEEYGSIGFEYFRFETEEEESNRLKKEVIDKQNQLIRKEEYLRREAESLGFKLEKKTNE